MKIRLYPQRYYSTTTNEFKINCYKVSISKEILKAADLKDDDELELVAKAGQLIIKKKNGNIGINSKEENTKDNT